MFHFKRRTLWIIIYITIPLIIILNSLGPEPDVSIRPESQPEAVLWSLDDLSTQCEANYCLLPLEGAQPVIVSAALTIAPSGAAEVPTDIQLSTYWLGGKLIGEVRTSNSKEALKSVNRFFAQWIPQSAEVQWVVSGGLSKAELEDLLPDESEFQNTGVEHEVSVLDGLTNLTSPKIGSEDQIAFLMWVEVLKRRLAGYDVQVRWDHRAEQSQVVINSTIAADSVSEVTQAEFANVVDVYMAAANQRQREITQLHRYAVNASVYGLPFQFFVQQPERLQAVTLADVNRFREQTLEQISKN